MTLRAAVTFENFQAHPCFRVFFYLAPFKKHKNSCVYHNLICWRYLITGTTVLVSILLCCCFDICNN